MGREEEVVSSSLLTSFCQSVHGVTPRPIRATYIHDNFRLYPLTASRPSVDIQPLPVQVSPLVLPPLPQYSIPPPLTTLKHSQRRWGRLLWLQYPITTPIPAVTTPILTTRCWMLRDSVAALAISPLAACNLLGDSFSLYCAVRSSKPHVSLSC